MPKFTVPLEKSTEIEKNICNYVWKFIAEIENEIKIGGVNPREVLTELGGLWYKNTTWEGRVGQWDFLGPIPSIGLFRLSQQLSTPIFS